jgi:pyruvate dehydrogenase E1 component alpha subunit
MPAWRVDGMDVLAVERATRRATDAIRSGSGPHFLELQTYRFRAHSMYDPDRYRDKTEIEQWKQRDPIMLLDKRLSDLGVWTDEDRQRLEDAVQSELDDAVAFAEASDIEPATDVTRFVYSESPRNER